MSTPTFGMTFTRPNDEPLPVLGADFSKILLIETSDNASATEYPVDTPVRISSSNREAVEALGTGYLADAVKGINAQLTGLNAGADVTIFRVKEGADVAATSAAIAECLASVSEIPSAVNATPRIIWAGRTAWRPDADTVNPIVAALPAACGRLLAIAPVDVDDTSAALAISARETMNSQRLMPIGVAARVYGEPTSSLGQWVRALQVYLHQLTISMVESHLTLLLTGQFKGWRASRNINFSLFDGSTEGQQMLEGNVSIVARGETGVDGAIADGGFVFIGTDNTDTGELWKQIHQVRGADYLTVKLAQITRQFLGPKITADTAEAWLNSQKFMLRDHKVDDDILGFEVKFIADRNSPEQIRLGHLTVNIGIEPAPAFKVANHEVRRYRPAVEGLVAEIIARLNATA